MQGYVFSSYYRHTLFNIFTEIQLDADTCVIGQFSYPCCAALAVKQSCTRVPLLSCRCFLSSRSALLPLLRPGPLSSRAPEAVVHLLLAAAPSAALSERPRLLRPPNVPVCCALRTSPSAARSIRCANELPRQSSSLYVWKYSS